MLQQALTVIALTCFVCGALVSRWPTAAKRRAAAARRRQAARVARVLDEMVPAGAAHFVSLYVDRPQPASALSRRWTIWLLSLAASVLLMMFSKSGGADRVAGLLLRGLGLERVGTAGTGEAVASTTHRTGKASSAETIAMAMIRQGGDTPAHPFDQERHQEVQEEQEQQQAPAKKRPAAASKPSPVASTRAVPPAAATRAARLATRPGRDEGQDGGRAGGLHKLPRITLLWPTNQPAVGDVLDQTGIICFVVDAANTDEAAKVIGRFDPHSGRIDEGYQFQPAKFSRRARRLDPGTLPGAPLDRSVDLFLPVPVEQRLQALQLKWLDSDRASHPNGAPIVEQVVTFEHGSNGTWDFTLVRDRRAGQ